MTIKFKPDLEKKIITSATDNQHHSQSDTNVAVSIRNVSKMYPLYNDPRDRLKQSLWYALPQFLRGKPRDFYREFWALRNISVEIKRGESLGIIGRNGSGKSTLLQIVAGTLAPTAGEVHLNGRVAALLELGSGFNKEFTGRENVYLNGSILGFSREEMDELFDEIAAFADIGEFMDQPVKFYSSGMFVRLAFAVQACVEPDILIVDEALSVGDIFFQQKCHDRMEKLQEQNTAIILVSHNMGAIQKYSTRTLLLNEGNCVFLGDPDEATYRYFAIKDKLSKSTVVLASDGLQGFLNKTSFKSTGILDWPDDETVLNTSDATIIGEKETARCTSIILCNEQGRACQSFQVGENAYFFYEFELLQDIEVPIGGVDITNAINILVHGKNSLHYQLEAPPVVRKGSRIRFRQVIELNITPGEYTFTVGLATKNIADYSRIRELHHNQLHQKGRTILRVRGGRILVRERIDGQGLTLPFHGYVDLKGNCALSILEPTAT